ncbi:HAD-IA family hydrolase [Candidatus Nanohaloarchaea archaeon]|nr:HAD-IA family hydrolase [Candidatus Nanohaloarchaea archaeon]
MSVAIFFDLDGTLITYPEDFRTLFEESIGSTVSDEVFDLYVDKLFQSIENLEDSPYQKAFREAEKVSDISFDADKAAEKYIEIELNATELNQNLYNLMKKLSEEHSVGILTNGEGRVQKKKVKKHEISDVADDIIISNEVGSRKPDQEIFQIAKDRLQADNYIYIGDTYEEDIEPAKEAGFKTIYISGENEADLQARNPNSLANLLNLLLD